MTIPFLAAFALQWVAIVALALLVLGLVRQVGILHERLGPIGALTLPGGVDVGAVAPRFDLPSLTGQPVTLGGESDDGSATLIFFLSPSCPVCKTLLPVVRSIARERAADARLILASDGDEPAQRALIRRERLDAYPYVLSTELGRVFGVGKLPYAVLLDGAGRLAAKGLVNNREHLDSLFEAERSGIASIQDYVARREAGLRSERTGAIG